MFKTLLLLCGHQAGVEFTGVLLVGYISSIAGN